MVEFALVFPILLLVIVGLIEAARLVFIYGSVVTASREAARYGSAAGLVSSDSDFLRYQDCAGITQRAEDVTFLTDTSNLTVTIEYDLGPEEALNSYRSDGYIISAWSDVCVDENGDGFDEGIDVTPYKSENSDPDIEPIFIPKRIVVTVSTVYEPMVPIVAPQFTTFTVETTSARTFLGVVQYWPE